VAPVCAALDGPQMLRIGSLVVVVVLFPKQPMERSRPLPHQSRGVKSPFSWLSYTTYPTSSELNRPHSDVSLLLPRARPPRGRMEREGREAHLSIRGPMWVRSFPSKNDKKNLNENIVRLAGMSRAPQSCLIHPVAGPGTLVTLGGAPFSRSTSCFVRPRALPFSCVPRVNSLQTGVLGRRRAIKFYLNERSVIPCPSAPQRLPDCFRR
jgi:hypothetical protein